METEYKTPPEKFTAFLKRQKMIFIVAFLGYVCAYLVRNNFKLMSKSIMVANEWTKDDIAMLLSCLTVSYGLAKFYTAHADAVARLLAAKGRGRQMPPPVLVAGPDQLEGIVTQLWSPMGFLSLGTPQS